LVQGPGYIYNLFNILPESAFVLGSSIAFVISSVIIITTGCIFSMWLGERITDKGIGNGISLLIMVGIIATLPQVFFQNIASRMNGEEGGGMIMVLIEVPVQYARRTADGGYEKNIFGSRQYIPLKLNASGVMPIIFAQAIMFIPAAVAGLSDSETAQGITAAFNNIFGFWYNFVFALLIIVFTYFYTAITVPTNKMADDLKRSGGFIPGFRIFPAIAVSLLGVQQGWALFFGGTSLLIMVGVAIDTVQQVNSYLLNRHYDGLMKTGSKRKAVA